MSIIPTKFSAILPVVCFFILEQPSVIAQLRHSPQSIDRKTNTNELLRRSFVPAVLVAGSAATWRLSKDFQGLRNQYLPAFRHKFDDYLQYTPAAMVFSLKAVGVKGKYDLKRTMVNYALSGIILAGLVNTLKYTWRVERPDGSARNSYPSGHTANAFMNATFLHREYGDRSLLYSIGGYTVAGATATGRLLNNRHWVSDVLAGAAIGIISAELGNYLAGKLCKPYGINNRRSTFSGAEILDPRFISLRIGYARPSNHSNPDCFFVQPGIDVAFEGGWFVNKYVGMGAEIGFIALPVHIDTNKGSVIFQPARGENNTYLTARYMRVGPVFRVPTGTGWTPGGKLMWGILSGPFAEATSDRVITYGMKKAFIWNAEINLQKKISDHLGIKTYLSYSDAKRSLGISESDQIQITGIQEQVNFHVFTWGIGLCTLF